MRTDLLSNFQLASSESESDPREILFSSPIRPSFFTSQLLPEQECQVQPILLEREVEGEDTGPVLEGPQSGCSGQAGESAVQGQKASVRAEELEKVSWTRCWLLKDGGGGDGEVERMLSWEAPASTKAWPEEKVA